MNEQLLCIYLLIILHHHLSNGIIKASLFVTTFMTVESVFYFAK